MKAILSGMTLFLSTVLNLAEKRESDSGYGQPSKGMASLITLEAGTFELGSPIPLYYKKRNISDAPITIWNSGFWPNHRIRVCDSIGRLIKLTDFGRVRYEAFDPGGERSKNYPSTIAPGTIDDSASPQDLAKLYEVTERGTYSVQVVYEEYQGDWEGQLWSNVIVFTIEAK